MDHYRPDRNIDSAPVLYKLLVILSFILIAAGFAYYVSFRPMDFRVYHFGANGVFDGTRPVYGELSGLGWPMHYRYPPLFLLLFAPFAWMPLGAGASVWVLLKVGILGAGISALSRSRPSSWQHGGSAPVVIPLLLATPYLIEEFRYGNVQFFIFALTAASLLLARARPLLSAASLALAISIKVWPLFFLPYLAARREWKVIGCALGFTALFTLLPAFHFGFGSNLDLLGQWFAQEFQTQLGQSEIWFPNQSLRGVLMRYLTHIDYSQVPDSNYPPVNITDIDPRIVRSLWMGIGGAAYVAFLAFVYRRRHSEGMIEAAIGFCLLALLQPFTQKYALGVLLLPAMVAGRLSWSGVPRILLYAGIALAVMQPLTPGAGAQRLFQTLGVDFLVTSLLALALFTNYSMTVRKP